MKIKGIDPRIQRGMEVQFELRRVRLQAGERSLGWKVGFGSPAAMERLGIDSPLVGFLTDSALLSSDSEASIRGWTKPAIEPEIALYIGKDLGVNADRETIRAGIEAIGPAIELADVDSPPVDIEAILGGNIYNRHVVLGKADRSRAGCILDGLTARVFRNDEELATTTDLLALTGDLIDVVHHVARTLASVGAQVRTGEVIIAGSIIPPIWAGPRMDFQYELDPVDSLSVHLSA